MYLFQIEIVSLSDFKKEMFQNLVCFSTLQKETCFINNTCYNYGDLNPSNDTLVCDSYENYYQWSLLKGEFTWQNTSPAKVFFRKAMSGRQINNHNSNTNKTAKQTIKVQDRNKWQEGEYWKWKWWWLFPCEDFGRLFDLSFPTCTFQKLFLSGD